MSIRNIFFKISFFLICTSLVSCAIPVAVFHGIGDSCVLNPGMKKFTKYFADRLGVYAQCIETGQGPYSWLSSFKAQAEEACNQIKNDKNFAGDFTVVGLSQGSLLARYVIQNCDMPGKVKNYISIGGPQMGVGSFPQCTGGSFCKYLNKLVNFAIYNSFVQNHVGPAGYFKDISNYESYLSNSSFLADLNNEKVQKNNSYKQRFQNLEKVILIKFDSDTMIIPKETAWFQFYDKNQSLIDLEKSDFYQLDFIGVKKLNEEKKIQFVALEGNHLRFTMDDVDKYMISTLK